MLIRTLEIQIGRILQLFTGANHRGMGHTGVKPHIQCISDFLIVLGIGAEQFSWVNIIPGINASIFHQQRNLFD